MGATATQSWLRTVLLSGIAFLSLTPLGRIYAELSPQTYEELKQEATEVLVVNVTSVENATNVQDDDECKIYFLVDAMVLYANKTSEGYENGDDIQFMSYYRTSETDQCAFYNGPGTPPLLTNEEAWCGLVYLAPSLDDKNSTMLMPAAFGRSFEEYSTEECEAVAAGEAVTVEPASSEPPPNDNRTVDPDDDTAAETSEGTLLVTRHHLLQLLIASASYVFFN